MAEYTLTDFDKYKVEQGPYLRVSILMLLLLVR